MSETRIDNWFKMGDGLVGTISGHPHQELFRTKVQYTSPLRELNEEEGYAVTVSGTRYILGKPASHEVFWGEIE